MSGRHATMRPRTEVQQGALADARVDDVPAVVMAALQSETPLVVSGTHAVVPAAEVGSEHHACPVAVSCRFSVVDVAHVLRSSEPAKIGAPGSR